VVACNSHLLELKRSCVSFGLEHRDFFAARSSSPRRLSSLPRYPTRVGPVPHSPEEFDLPTASAGVVMPVRYIKVVPLVAWGSPRAQFNFSIWHVALDGVSDHPYVTAKVSEFEKLQHHEAIRLCLKYVQHPPHPCSKESVDIRRFWNFFYTRLFTYESEQSDDFFCA